MCVEPAFRLMFRPFGSALITYVSAPRASNTALAMFQLEPFAQSRPTFTPRKEYMPSEMR